MILIFRVVLFVLFFLPVQYFSVFFPLLGFSFVLLRLTVLSKPVIIWKDNLERLKKIRIISFHLNNYFGQSLGFQEKKKMFSRHSTWDKPIFLIFLKFNVSEDRQLISVIVKDTLSNLFKYVNFFHDSTLWSGTCKWQYQVPTF